METQVETIKKLLRRPKGVTSMDAFGYGITRLSAIIFDLKRAGWNIETINEKNANNNAVYARYFLIEEVNNG